MSALAGPGPSTMASTSMVPTSARMKVKKRVINLVNPADPQDFSTQSISPSASPNASSRSIEEEGDMNPPTLRFSQTTQTFNYTPGVKGILRSTGTPGSGNGVRFFPKNKFRIITPNASVHQPTPKPPPSPTNSFFSQLLAVTIPSISSPRRSSSDVGKADESWEVPGQEGEISLIASSTISEDENRSIIVHNWDEQVDEREIEDSIDIYENENEKENSWNGQPNIHCSPLTLPEEPDNTSKEISMISFGQNDKEEMISVDFNYPEDMSNLLSTKFQSDENSFSIADPPSTSTIIAPHREILSPVREESISNGTEDEFWNNPSNNENQAVEQDISIVSDRSEDLNDLSNPTIRRPAISTQITQPMDSPTPNPIGPYTSSIFADMSAEQADLTWPLTRRSEEEELSSNFVSPIKSPPSSGGNLQTPKATGDVTQFFDTTMTMSFSSPSPSSLTSTLVLRQSPQNKDLIVPTQKMIEAQISHTQALKAELELYKDLARKLQNEVSERDECLAKVNLRALDAELLHNQVKDLEKELARKSISPSPSPTLRAGLRPSSASTNGAMCDRTMTAQNEAKELEITLAKAKADSQDLVRQLNEMRIQKDGLEKELRQTQSQKMQLEEQERDKLVKDQAIQEELEILKRELEYAHRQIKQTEGKRHDDRQEEIDELQRELDDARQRISNADEMQDELHALKAELESAHNQLDEFESKADVEKELHEVQRELHEAHEEIERLNDKEEEVEALHAELRSAQDKIENLESQSFKLSYEQDLQNANEKIADLKILNKELTEARLVDEDEIEKLVSQLDKHQGYKKSEENARKRIEEVERRFEIEQRIREDIEKKLQEEENFIHDLEKENEILRQQLANSDGQSTLSRSPVDPSISALKDEITKLRSETASKDLEIVNLQKRKAELKEDREMLNIALDSKQQEVELMKRKFSVKGIAGSTPLGNSRKINNNNLDTPSVIDETPLPGKGRSSIQNRRKSSLNLTQTPLPNIPKHLPSLQTPSNNKHGIQLYPSTRLTSRVMKKVEEEENVPPLKRRERMLA
ncbi:uncharacterized protein I206_105240 [Kwoniella pini CBS 10737]|uniref:Uncharacterized protein n=1 Tax=Kwoniella pini CBS 10737 TaxID=1296096 RepID=A0A1B9I4U4_9TREE|nr:uncharacterized protein I206_03851 [Kwoniella pini CBS 10737]OCF50526.1 hypothetical protein I206_03851 [Kwoniella pini CBS 10737]